MTDATNQKFIVFFQIPADVMDNWKNTDPETRRPAEQKMSADWTRWTENHPGLILSTEAGGKTKRVTASGASDARNNIVLVSIIEAASHEAAAEMFEDHPHLGIPQASIEIMHLKAMGPM